MQANLENPLKGKVVLVTGGAQGLGKAICQQLVDGGANVILGDIQEEKGKETVKSLAKNGENICFKHLDMSQAAEVQQVIYNIKAKYGRLDAIVNNAGIDFTKPILSLTVEQWDAAMAINLRGLLSAQNSGWR